jgi:hypothetical protein
MINCASCASPFTPPRSTSRHCSEACRVKDWRRAQSRHREMLARLLEQRTRLAAEAKSALASGDVVNLERVARSTVSLLAG